MATTTTTNPATNQTPREPVRYLTNTVTEMLTLGALQPGVQPKLELESQLNCIIGKEFGGCHPVGVRHFNVGTSYSALGYHANKGGRCPSHNGLRKARSIGGIARD